ncbi:MAG TPA: hypothetical protein VIN34_10855 [Candidatus Limnocylindria bacterium]|jgi:hypothetical protein
MSRSIRVLAALAVIAAALAAVAAPASAHEDRTVGPYRLDVGFATEPAYAGQPNALYLEVTDTRDDKPVEGLEKTLKAEVSFGGLAALPLTLTPRFGQPGVYAGQFIPTKPGSYIFHLTGKIGTQDIDEKFESGPSRFNDVTGPGALQYPEKVPGGSDLGRTLSDLRSDIDQLRLLAIAGVAVAIAIAIAVPLALSRRRR